MAEYVYDYIGGGLGVINAQAAWIEVLDLMDHEEANADRRETRRHVYLSALPQGGDELMSREPEPETVVCRLDSQVEIAQILDTLTARQLEVVRKRLDGMSIREIAQEEGVTHVAILKVINSVRESMKNSEK